MYPPTERPPALPVAFDPTLRSQRERTLRTIAIVFASIAWVLLCVSIVGAVYGVFIAAFVAVAHAMFLAHVRGNAVKVGPNQLPDIWDRVMRASAHLGLGEPPEVYVMQAGGVLNAFATKLFGRRFVILHSEIVDACTIAAAARGRSGQPDELDFVVAHEIGHLAAGHLNWFLLPMRLIPLLGPAYSRACEYTCDRCGHSVVADLEVSSRALAILAVGGRRAQQVNLDAFVGQRHESGQFWMAVYELNASHPYLPKRIAALREMAQPGSQPEVSRNAASYPLAPFLAFGAGGGAAVGGLVIVAVIGMMAAIAIPAFMKYEKRAKEARTSSTERQLLPSPDEPNASVQRGDRYAWTMDALPAPWAEVPVVEARRQNALSDRWFSRADLDAHVLIVVEPVVAGATLDNLVNAVLKNAAGTMDHFKVTESRPLGTGRLVATRGTMKSNHADLAFRYAIFLSERGMYQVMAFAPAATMNQLQPSIDAQLASFKPE